MIDMRGKKISIFNVIFQLKFLYLKKSFKCVQKV